MNHDLFNGAEDDQNDLILVNVDGVITLGAIQTEIERLVLEKIPKIFIVLSNKSYDSLTMESVKGVKTIPIEIDSSNEEYYKLVKQFIGYVE